jgi:hypothetical protein
MRKNVAGQVVSAHLVAKADGTDVTSGTTTVYVTGDGGTQASGGTATHEGNGNWSFLPSQANTNYDQVVFTFVNSNAISVDIQVYPVAFDPTDAADLGVTALTGHTPQTGDSFARLGAPAGASIAADLVVIDNFVDDLETRLTATRAGYLDELGPTNVPQDVDTLLTRLSAARAGYLDNLNGHTAQTGDTFAKLAGITLLAEWLGALAGKQVANATARTEIWGRHLR